MSTTEETFIAYYRVSTKGQGQSGLGLESQKSCVTNFASTKGGTITAEFTEVESGKKNNRPQLAKAIAAATATGATLIIAKLDRLARNASFILSLRDSGVKFVACDMPEANTLTIGIMALLAQQEAEMISARTKAALEAKRARGEKLGNPDNFTNEGRRKGGKARSTKARNNEHNRRATQLIIALREAGKPYREIAKTLNESGYLSSRGNQFSGKSVEVLFKRATQ